MGIRTGSEYIETLRHAPRHVEIQGETVTSGIADHPAFRNVVRTYAELYDLQHRPELADVMTYTSPTSGDPVATSFMVPRTPEDLAALPDALFQAVNWRGQDGVAASQTDSSAISPSEPEAVHDDRRYRALRVQVSRTLA